MGRGRGASHGFCSFSENGTLQSHLPVDGLRWAWAEPVRGRPGWDRERWALGACCPPTGTNPRGKEGAGLGIPGSPAEWPPGPQGYGAGIPRMLGGGCGILSFLVGLVGALPPTPASDAPWPLASSPRSPVLCKCRHVRTETRVEVREQGSQIPGLKQVRGYQRLGSLRGEQGGLGS